MSIQIKIEEITVDVVLKKIKNLHLRVYPPNGRVQITAPEKMDLEIIRDFAHSKHHWIKKQQKMIRDRERVTPVYIDGESHFSWGKAYRLRVVEVDRVPEVDLVQGELILRLRPEADASKRQAILDGWYRKQIREVTQLLVEKWEPVLGVRVEKIFVRRMKTRWGSCSTRKRTIRLNTELARRAPEFLEYVVVHEMVHLLEASHNRRFYGLMDQFLPGWKKLRKDLNQSSRFPGID